MNRGIICNFRLEQRLVVVDKHPPCVPVPDTDFQQQPTSRCAGGGAYTSFCAADGGLLKITLLEIFALRPPTVSSELTSMVSRRSWPVQCT